MINRISFLPELPRGGPHIQGYDAISNVKLGDTIMLNCTSLKSKPAAKLQFYINDRKVGLQDYLFFILFNAGFMTLISIYNKMVYCWLPQGYISIRDAPEPI